MTRPFLPCAVVLLAAAAACAARAADPASPPITRLETMSPLPDTIEGLETERVRVSVDSARTLGPFPPLQGDLSQGAETGDPLFFEEMEDLLREIRPALVRVAPFAEINAAVALDDNGELVTDFTRGERIVNSLRRAGAEICWNCASWPEDWTGGYPHDLDLFEEYVRRVVEHFNGDGSRDIHYIEFWNEPNGFDDVTYDAMARGARAADPGVKLGAPAVMDLNERAVEEALEHSETTGVPLDFISFHLYGKAPWDWPDYIRRAQNILDRYQGKERLEMVITEWGLDAGESGVCDTLYNAAYYCSVLEAMIPYWPQVRPCFFEAREGWDWKGPSRDLFGRWGMLTYSNLVPKPVFQAARMWARMEGDRVAVETTDERVRAVAAVSSDQVAVLVWSFPRDLWLLPPTSPLLFEPSSHDIPVEIHIANLPFASTGLAYERFHLDFLHSNVNASPHRTALDKVHEVVLAHGKERDTFEVPIVLPLHAVTLLVLRPAERAPADVVAVPDRYQVWAGESAEITVLPRTDETFDAEWIPDPVEIPGWDVEIAGRDPLRLRVIPHRPDLRGPRFFTAWIRRLDWGAWGRAVAEFRVDTPIAAEPASWRVDLDAATRSGTVAIPFRNKTPDPRRLAVRWHGDPDLEILTSSELSGPPRPCVAGEPDSAVGHEQASSAESSGPAGQGRRGRAVETTTTRSTAEETTRVEIPAASTAEAAVRVRVRDDVPPGRFLLDAVPDTGIELAPVTTEIFLPLASRRFGQPPRIDGALDEWPQDTIVRISGAANWDGHHASRYTGPDDLHGTIRSGWDKTFLYFAVEVADDDHYAPVANGAMHEYDCVHMGFDLRRDMLDRREFFYEDDCDYLFTFTDHGVAYRHWGAKRPEEVPEHVRVGARQANNLTTYEIALPWQEEFVPYATPEPGRVIGFSIYLRDIDPGEEQGYLHWGRGLEWHTKRPALFWSLQLTR